MFGVIISSGKATLRELKEYYTLDDAFVLYNIIYTDNYNNSIIQNNIKRMSKQKG